MAAERFSRCYSKSSGSLHRHAFDFQIDRSGTGEPIEFHHAGLIALVTVQDEVHLVEDVEDVKGVELVDPPQHSVEEFTPTFSYALSLLASDTSED